MSKVDTDQLSDEETAQRRDAIVHVMARTPPQPRVPKRPPVKARRKAAPTASGRKAPSDTAVTSS